LGGLAGAILTDPRRRFRVRAVTRKPDPPAAQRRARASAEILAADIGHCALGIFTRGTELVGKSIGIAGEHLTGAQMAEQLSLALGEPMLHDALSPAQYRALGFPGADDLGNMFQFKRGFEHAYCAARSVACARELHPQLRTIAEWLAGEPWTAAAHRGSGGARRVNGRRALRPAR